MKFINSATYNPQSNGYCKAVHKEIKKFLSDEYNKYKDKFDIEY